MKLVPIIWRVLGKRFESALRFFFGWQSRLPVMIVTRKQLHNFAHDMCDHAVYETSQAYESRITAATNQAYDSLLAALEKQNVEPK